MPAPTIKIKLYAICQDYVSNRMNAAREAMAGAQGSANEETKSSSGDKYETGRAMAQLEIEKNAMQLAESIKLKHALDKIRIDFSPETAQAGSVVVTDRASIFLAISIGRVDVDGKAFTVISPASPLGRQLVGSKPGDMRTFNNQTYLVHELI